MWISILLTAIAILVATAYWFGFRAKNHPSPPPAKASDETPSNRAKESLKKPEKKQHPRRPTSKISYKEKRKLPTDPRFLRRFGGHSDVILAMAISPSGEWMATAGKDGQVRVAQVAKGSNRYLNTMLAREGMFQDHLSTLSWLGDGRTLVGTMAHSRNVCFFRIRKKEGDATSGTSSTFPLELHELTKRRFSTSSKVDDTICACLADQTHSNFCLIVTNTVGGGRGNTVAWDGKTGQAVGVVSTGEGQIRWSPDGRFLCGQGAGTAQVKVLEVLYKKVKGEAEPIFDSISAKGAMTVILAKAKIVDIAFCHMDKMIICCDDGSIQIWDLNVEYRLREDPKLLCSSDVLKGDKIVRVATSFLGDVNRIAIATDNTKLHVLTYLSSSSLLSLDFSIEQSHPEGVSDLQFCPATGNVLYSRGEHSKDVFAWNVE